MPAELAQALLLALSPRSRLDGDVATTERLLTIAQAAQILRCHPRTLRRRIERGELPVFRDGRLVRIRQADLASYIARRVSEPQSPVRSEKPLRARSGWSAPSGRLYDVPDPLSGCVRGVDLQSVDTGKRPGGAETPRGRQQGGTPDA